MSNRAFLDTNIFIYACDDRDRPKQDQAKQLIRDSLESGNGVISYQVIHEFFNFALVKAAVRMTSGDAWRYLEDVFRPLWVVGSSTGLVSDAIGLQERYQLTWYDSLIVSAALQAQCSVLYSEDLQNGHRFGELTITNPFRSTSAHS